MHAEVLDDVVDRLELGHVVSLDGAPGWRAVFTGPAGTGSLTVPARVTRCRGVLIADYGGPARVFTAGSLTCVPPTLYPGTTGAGDVAAGGPGELTALDRKSTIPPSQRVRFWPEERNTHDDSG